MLLFHRLIDEGQPRLVEQSYCVGIEGTGLVERLKYAKPHLVRCFRADDGIRPTIIGEVETWTSCITVQRRVLHNLILNTLKLSVDLLCRGCRRSCRSDPAVSLNSSRCRTSSTAKSPPLPRLSSKSVLTLFIRPEQPGISKKVSRYDGKCAAGIAA